MTPPEGQPPASSPAPSASDTDAGEGSPKQDPGRAFFDTLAEPFRNEDSKAAAKAPNAGSSKPDEEAAASKAADEKKAADEAKAKGDAASGEQKPYAVYGSKEEHDRAIQAETDRRESQRKTREAQEERRRLRRDDPVAYAQLEEQLEQKEGESQSQVEMASQVISIYDGSVLSPLLSKLPEDKRLEIEQSIDSLPARTKAVEAALTILLDNARADGEKAGMAKARENPAFRKEILSEVRQGRSAIDVIEGGSPGGSGMSTNEAANNFLRRSAKVHAS